MIRQGLSGLQLPVETDDIGQVIGHPGRLGQGLTGIWAEAAKGDRAPTATRTSGCPTVQESDVEHDHVAGLARPRDDVPVVALGFDVR